MNRGCFVRGKFEPVALCVPIYDQRAIVGGNRVICPPSQGRLLSSRHFYLEEAEISAMNNHHENRGVMTIAATSAANTAFRIMYIMFNYDGLGTWSPCGLAHDCVNLPGRT